MRWHSVILIAGVFLVVESAKYSHEKKSHFTSVEDEEEKENERSEDNEHIFDVKKIVKGTIDAIGGKGTTPKPDGLYSLFQLPSEILTQIASDAGYIEPSTTVLPKRKKRRNHKAKKYRKVSEDGSYEGTYVRVEDEDDEEDEDAYKPRKKNKSKRRHHRPIYLPPNYVPPPMVSSPLVSSPLVSSPPLHQSLRTHQIPHEDPIGVPIQSIRRQVPQMDPITSIFAPLPTFTFAPLTIPTTTTTPSPPTMAPLSIQPLQSASPLADSVGAQYAYQPVVQADGKTYYHRVLVLPPTHEGDPSPQVIMPTTQPTTTIQPSTTTNSFVTENPSTTTEEPSTTVGIKRKTKIRRRLIKNAKTENPLPAEAIQQLPQSDSPVITTTMRSVAITFSPNLELFKTKAPSVEIPLQEQKEVKIKPRTHGTRTHSVGKAIESGTSNEELTNEPALRYVKDEETEESEETTSSSLPTPPLPPFSPKLITTQLPSIEEQMKNNEVFSVSLETGKKGSGTLSVPQVTALHSIANRRLQAEEDYLPPIEEKKGKKKGRKEKKERKEERVKKVESTEIEDIKEAVEAVRREKKEKVQRRFHLEEEKEKEEDEETEMTTQKPKRRHHKKKSHRVIEVDTPKKISLSPPEEETAESSIPSVSPPSSSFRRSLTPALIDVRELNDSPRTTSPSIRHIHHAERLAILRKSLEARARGVSEEERRKEKEERRKEKEERRKEKEERRKEKEEGRKEKEERRKEKEEGKLQVKQLSTQDKEDDEEEKGEIEESKSTPLYSDLFPSTTTEIAKKKKTRRHRKRKTTVAPTTTTTTTTTTTEIPTTTEEKEESYELSDDDYEEESKEKRDLSYEIDEDGDKVVKKRTKTTTTTEVPSTTTVSSKKLKVLRPHCLNIRSFARQFGMVDVFDFVEEHCSFIENYYPSLTCERREEYLAYCAGVWDSTKL